MRNARGIFGLSGVVLVLTITGGCRKNDTVSGGGADASGSAATASPSGAPLSGLDACLVGNWKASGVSLKMNKLDAAGGAGAHLTIDGKGASTLDFTPMAVIHAKEAAFSFDFSYSGKASAQLQTPTRGVVESSQNDFGSLRVSATIQLPGAGRMPLFKDTPVKDLANAAGGIAKGLGNTPAPAAPAKPVPAGIEANPVFSNSTYSCAGDALTLTARTGGAVWTFVRAAG